MGDSIGSKKIIEALVQTYNDRGGILGRQIEAVYADVDTASSSWDADFAAACAKFTQDNDVAVVLGHAFSHVESFEACLSKERVPHLSTTYNVPDSEVLARYPLLLGLKSPRIERRSITKIDGGLRTKVITKASKLGVMTDACPGTNQAWQDVIRPYIERHGLEIASTFETQCEHGSGDAGQKYGQFPNMVLQFRSAGVDRVLFMSVSEGPPLLVFANAAESQQYRPGYVVSSLAGLAILEDQMPSAQAANVHGFGWLPSDDVKPPHYPEMTEPARRCLKLLSAKHIVPKEPLDYRAAFQTCEQLFLYEIALRANAGNSDGPKIIGAIEALGEGYISAVNLEGRTNYGPNRHDAPSVARHVAWDMSCSCFTYRRTSLIIPPLAS